MEKISKIVDNFQTKAMFFFTSKDIEMMGFSKVAVTKALARLRANNTICTPVVGFNVILRGVERKFGSPPPEAFVDQLMKYWGTDYYVSLLSSAQWHGAAHQLPQVFQVVTSKQKRELNLGHIKIEFILKTKFPDEKWILSRNTQSGVIRYASAELTAFELVHYMRQSSGVSHVATLLKELTDAIDIHKFKSTNKLPFSISVFQRLGYLLDFLGKEEYSKCLINKVQRYANIFVPLVAGMKTAGSKKNEKWKIIINYEVEPDI